ncbi:hypothetical protein EDD18DRAFT_350882 [Armillaria luteobubalina]|uniref:Uncharacterized protein n=1 Tax=Armillaria luteobubalina TaxID=153913 RepID=A0AA39UMS8_9AGAR|nr:hypothetical protein EDD18DRAFT_350882 [Armillaria luteobubalina]
MKRSSWDKWSLRRHPRLCLALIGPLSSDSCLSNPVVTRMKRKIQTIRSRYATSRALLYPSISALPSADLTRSSYLTNSSLYSRMSNLSDFPVPPVQDAPPRVSYTSSYFDDQYTTRDARSVTSSKRMTFGGDEEIDQLLASLSTS